MSKGNLKEILKFPIVGYEKLNGFLGLVSYNHLNNDFYICTKSSSEGEYAGYLKKLFYKKINNLKRDYLLNYLKENDVTLAFEAIDIENDPHIIKYNESNLVLLSIIKNDIYFNELPFNEVVSLGLELNLDVAQPLITLNNFSEFVNYYNDVILKENIYDIEGAHLEGLVFKDVNNFMFKVKFPYYSYWKYMRGLVNKYLNLHVAIKNSRDIKSSEQDILLSNLNERDRDILLKIINIHFTNNMTKVDMLSYLEDDELLNYLSSLDNVLKNSVS